MFRVQWIPQDTIRNHPAIRQEDIRAKLHRNHFVIYLDDNPANPTAHALLVLLMVTIDLNRVAHLKIMLAAWSSHVRELRQAWSFLLAIIIICQSSWR